MVPDESAYGPVPESERGFNMIKKLLTASVCAAALLAAPTVTGTSLVSKAYAADPAQTSAVDALEVYLASEMSLGDALAQLVKDGYPAADVVVAANSLASDNPDMVASIGATLAALANELAASDDSSCQGYLGGPSDVCQEYAAALDGAVVGTQLADAYGDARGTTGSINGGAGEVSPSNVGNTTNTNEAPASSS